MDETELVTGYLVKNIDKIYDFGKSVFGKVDTNVQIALKTAYTKYLVATQKKYSKSKSFFIRHEPVDLYTYYVPTGIACDKKTITRPSFRGLVDTSSRVVITGSGGSGKSILMKHLFLDCIKDGFYVPILVELRDLNSYGKGLDDFVTNTLDTFGFDVNGDYLKKAKQADHFCYFLDGYDEVGSSQKPNLIKEIVNLSKRHPGSPIFISSRSDDVCGAFEDFSIFAMEPLDLDSAVSLVEKLPFDETIKSKFIENLKNGLFQEHESFLSNPLLLSIMLLTYSENAEIPSKLSVFYNQAYEALFQRHDAYKGGFRRDRKTSLDIQDFAKVFSLFALQTYEKRIFKMPKTSCLEFIDKCQKSLAMNFKADDYLADLISAACLLVEDGLEIAFSHRSFQEYFVARHISQAMPDIQGKLIDRYWKNIESDNVVSLLSEINQDLVESCLLVPKLEEFFESIGVKRMIGVTHAARYFKATYSELSIDDEHIRATFKNKPSSYSALLRMAISICGTYSMPGKDYFDEFRNDFQRIHGKVGGMAIYKTSKISLRSPVLMDLVRGRGAFSVEYLEGAYKAFKILKSKHNNAAQNLDSLLGIRN